MRGRLLALSGKRFAGKDTVAGLVCALAAERGLEVACFAFADESKRAFAASLGGAVSAERLRSERAYKEAWRPRLTEFTSAALARDPLVFCRAVAERAAGRPGPSIVSDLRLPAELEHLRGRFDVWLVRVSRSPSERARSGWVYSPAADEHATETALDDPSYWDEELDNSGDLAALRDQVAGRLRGWLLGAGA